MSGSGQGHWDEIYRTKALNEVSWYESAPERSLALIRATGIDPSDPIIDVGGGGSYLVDSFLAVHHTPSNAEQQFLYALLRRA